MAERKSSTTLPRLRVSSHSFGDFSSHNISTLTSRTVSSSTSTISTPSNNIRRVKQEQAFVDKKIDQKKKQRSRRADCQQDGTKASKKLLNFQQSRKSYAPSQSFVLHKPANLSQFDHSVFTKRPPPPRDDSAILPQSSFSPSSPPETIKPDLLPVRQSQIKAWESAENITTNRVFDYSKPDDESWLDDDSYDFGAEEEVSIDRGTDEWTEPSDPPGILLSIPGLSKAELGIVKEQFSRLEECHESPDPEMYEKEEKKALWAHAMRESEEYEKLYASNHTISGKRRVQVLQKRAFLQKLYGYFNNINTEFTTNNSSYSSVDNAMSAQKAFLEDKEELCELLEQQQAYQQSLNDTKDRLMSLSQSHPNFAAENAYSEVDPAKLIEATSHWLSAHYQRNNSDPQFESDDDDPEVVAAAIIHLKGCVNSATDETMEE